MVAKKRASKRAVPRGVVREWRVRLPPNDMWIELAVTADRTIMADRGLVVSSTARAAGLFTPYPPIFEGMSKFGGIIIYAPRLVIPYSIIVHECFHAISWKYHSMAHQAHSWATPTTFPLAKTKRMIREEAMAHQLEWLFSECIRCVSDDSRISLTPN